MMNMKKLIDETDFDNLSELTKRWGNTQKQAPTPHKVQNQKQNDFKKSNQSILRKQDKLKQEQKQAINTQFVTQVPRKHNVVPQIIDEDTQHFKNKLEHLLNNFKTDAVSQFMGMKREMLNYQQECVKNQTHKYLTMYEEKHKELAQTKQKLIQTSRQLQKRNQQVENLSNHISKLNQRMKTYKYVSRPFSILYESKIIGKQMKFKMKQAQKYDKKRLLKKSVLGWVALYKEYKNDKQKQESQLRIQKQVNDIVGRFQKQMQLLKQRLEEATHKNQEYQNNKHVMQQNLKKAFLRGVCAMNMEAMGVLGNENVEQNDWVSQKQKSPMINQSYLSTKNQRVVNKQDVNHNFSMIVSKQSQKNVKSQTNLSHIQKNENIILKPQKAESKNFKWKQAPIMGVQQVKDEQQPRTQIVRPSTQGKVIKVIQGKSTVEIKKNNNNDKNSVTNSRKKI